MKSKKTSESEIKRLLKIKGANLRQKFQNSHFFEEEYDEAIVGVLSIRDQIVYDADKMLSILLDEFQNSMVLQFNGLNNNRYPSEMAKRMINRFLMCDDKAVKGVLGKTPPLLVTFTYRPTQSKLNSNSKIEKLSRIEGSVLRQKFPTCHVFEKEYDEAIVGVLTYRDQIVYDANRLLQILMDEYQDRLALQYGGYDTDGYYIEMFKRMAGRFFKYEEMFANGKLDKTPPILMTFTDGMTQWIPLEKLNNNVGDDMRNTSSIN
jgi:hypothetical protein